jgi:HD-like signal output (HDOD) protein/ActR/RegA family two-component response regulator
MADEPTKKAVIFVDDEPNVLSGLRRMLRPFRKDWNMDFVASGLDALERMATQAYDVIVTDVRMPGMDGTELLTKISQRYPKVVRIVLSGEMGDDTRLRVLELAHQHLSKPCDADLLRHTVERACALHGLLTDPKLEGIISQMGHLPSLPSNYAELLAELRSEQTNFDRITQIISRDVGMSVKVLQIVNSAFIGIRTKVGNLNQAITLLGLKTISSLALSVQAFSQFDVSKVKDFSVDVLMNRSVATGALAKRIAEMLGYRDLADDAFMAGLLQDTGKLVLIERMSKEYAKVMTLGKRDVRLIVPAEYKLLDTSHAEVGAYLLGLWGLPDPILEALAYHHRPNDYLVRDFTPLTASHLADLIAICPEGAPIGPFVNPSSRAYLQDMGLLKELPALQAMAREDADAEKTAKAG